MNIAVFEPTLTHSYAYVSQLGHQALFFISTRKQDQAPDTSSQYYMRSWTIGSSFSTMLTAFSSRPSHPGCKLNLCSFTNLEVDSNSLKPLQKAVGSQG